MGHFYACLLVLGRFTMRKGIFVQMRYSVLQNSFR